MYEYLTQTDVMFPYSATKQKSHLYKTIFYNHERTFNANRFCNTLTCFAMTVNDGMEQTRGKSPWGNSESAVKVRLALHFVRHCDDER